MKSVWVMRVVEQFRSHPTGVRGLKFRSHNWMMEKVESHPTGVRGLKSPVWTSQTACGCRTPLGCVD